VLHPSSLMPTTMVLESGWQPMSTLAEGVAATMRLIGDPELATTTGQFYDVARLARAEPEAYEPEFRRELARVTDQILG